MDFETKEKYCWLANNLLHHRQFQNPHKLNEPMLDGKMNSLGWRKGYNKGSHIGITAIGAKVAKAPEKSRDLFHETIFINDFIADRFRNVSVQMYEEVKQHHTTLTLPCLH
ncbi:hypothetical protein PSTT_04208 [Puccinia striiformis]|uniref:Tet-like 2OG-Fe(II) oxygenase domain-containing protein n=1 Tax=Puccinia striiformis TaxID=27350 RepID=A0A2S4VSY3_9BASI|nr:hypothetical protein PSTT_04208 [Puccinia striiformis]